MSSAKFTDWPDGGSPHDEQASAAVLPLDRARVIQRLGYNLPGAAVPPYVAHELDAAWQNAISLMVPRGTWVVVQAKLDDARQSLICARRCLAVGPIVAAQIRRSTAAAFFVATIGRALEGEVARLFHSDRAFEGFVLSTIGSEAVEAWADVVAQRIAVKADSLGWGCTNRFSPGYCTWNTAGQRELFDLLPPQPAGVTLTPYVIMVPLKSVSGLMGLGPDVECRPYPCDHCLIEDCTYRPVTTGRT
jgi:hypothetical protein